jgi:5-methylcytosine-specific restriction endonuclease McrA
MSNIPDALRDQVIKRANGYCEYCQAEMEIIIFINIDHIQPESEGGKTTEDNLCLTCPTCNNAKSAHQTGIDPTTNTVHSLFNPRIQRWSDHFQWNATFTQITGKTAVGRATINRLEMNRPLMLAARRRWRRAGWSPPA